MQSPSRNTAAAENPHQLALDRFPRLAHAEMPTGERLREIGQPPATRPAPAVPCGQDSYLLHDPREIPERWDGLS